MSALRIDWTLSSVRCSSYIPSKNTWASMRKRSWIQLDQQLSRCPRLGCSRNGSCPGTKGESQCIRGSLRPRTRRRRAHLAQRPGTIANSTTTTTRANGGGPDIASLRTLAIQKRVLRGSRRQTGRFCCKKIAIPRPLAEHVLAFSDRYTAWGKTQQDI
jgi:hypothetical protein